VCKDDRLTRPYLTISRCLLYTPNRASCPCSFSVTAKKGKPSNCPALTTGLAQGLRRAPCQRTLSCKTTILDDREFIDIHQVIIKSFSIFNVPNLARCRSTSPVSLNCKRLQVQITSTLHIIHTSSIVSCLLQIPWTPPLLSPTAATGLRVTMLGRVLSTLFGAIFRAEKYDVVIITSTDRGL